MTPVRCIVGKILVLGGYLLTYSLTSFRKASRSRFFLLLSHFMSNKHISLGSSFFRKQHLLQNPFATEELGKGAEGDRLYMCTYNEGAYRETCRGRVKTPHSQAFTFPSLEWSHRETGVEVSQQLQEILSTGEKLFGFSVLMKVVFTLHCSLLTAQQHYV